ncbi:hypothetical protein SRABI13_01654 [Erwinia aphidicola]|uniref:tail fiber domain-containing protein n=1 Tax=Erwinia aphidicola TaxID=68334 RepID=UPI001D8F46E1|nr:tail fiber domain-containing protein [Erwinia aphidicola]CAH0198024.1 hypothetical protein SRABI13_01654 [Erwinia aphidicola]
MPAGTIALTNNSATVGGTGTAFTTELKAGDFIGVTVGGAPYTMIVASIASNTQLTIAQAYNGPTASGLAWYGVPSTLKYAITQQVLNDMATNQRGMIAQLANWQKIYSDAESVTVERPDRSTFTGPSWGYMAAQYGRLGNSATRNVGNTTNTVAAGDDSRLNTLDGKSGGTVTGNTRFNTTSVQITPTSDVNGWASSLAFTANDVAKSNMAVAYTDNYGDFTLQTGGVGGAKLFKFGKTGNGTALNGSWVSASTAGLAVEAGERNRVEINNTASGDSTGNPVGWTVYRWYNELTQTGIRRAGDTSIQSYFIAMTGAGSWEFQKSGSATAPGSWVNGSDERHKTKITAVPDALASVLSWRGATYVKKDGAAEVGLIAQDVEKACPVAVSTNGDRTFQDGTVIPDFKYLNTSGAAAAFHTEAIKALFSIVEMLALDNPEVLAVVDKIKASAEEIGKREVESEATWKDEPPVLDVPSNEESQSGS